MEQNKKIKVEKVEKKKSKKQKSQLVMFITGWDNNRVLWKLIVFYLYIMCIL